MASASALTALGLLTAVLLGGCLDPAVVAPPEHPDLTAEQLRQMLASGTFRARLEARRQLDKLDPETKLAVLLPLLDHENAAIRLLAVEGLHSVDFPQAREALARLAEEDPSPIVRARAASRKEAQNVGALD